ncbi:MAG TPA: CvpA family protein [bacterium]|nr:CvpA family protein [bacterium]
MHYFDIFVLTIVGLFALAGTRRGLVEELLKIIGLIAAILIAINYVHIVAAKLAAMFDSSPEKLTVISFILIILVVMFGAKLLMELLKRFLQFAMLSWVDRAGGAMFGAVKATILLSLLLWGLLLLPVERYTNDLEQNTETYAVILGVAPTIYDGVIRVFPGARHFIHRMENYLPVGGDQSTFARFNRETPLDRLAELLGDDVDMEVLRDFSEEKVQELLESPELREELRRRLKRQQQGSVPELQREQQQRRKVSHVY